MRSQIGGPKVTPPIDFRFPAGFHNVAKQASFSIAFFQQFWWLGETKIDTQISFQSFFFGVIFASVLTSKFGRFSESRKQKNSNCFKEKKMIFTKSALSIKIKKTMNFHVIFGGPNEENSKKNQLKNALFLSIAFLAFSGDFACVLEAKKKH